MTGHEGDEEVMTMDPVDPMDPAAALAHLNDEQQAAARAVSGPVVIHAGAGTGKTRVITHRAAFAAATGAMDPRRALLVTFTDKAATEMSARIAALGVTGISAMTFHKAAWRQLRYFWPQVTDGEALEILNNPWQLVSPLVRRLPGNYRFTPTKDVLEAISWIKSRRIDPAGLQAEATTTGRALPVPDDLMRGILSAYEAAKARRSLVDFDDMILRTTDLLAAHPELLASVRSRYAWFSVDEFQDTNPAQFDLLRLWLGDRDDLCVVGDQHQTIYSFTGASSQYLATFPALFPGAREFDLTTNYRSTPQVLHLANRLLSVSPGRIALRATAAPGPHPSITMYPDAESELTGIRLQLADWAAEGIPHHRMAVLVRLNADIAPLESELTRAGIPFQVRGTHFYERSEVRAAVRQLHAEPAATLSGPELAAWFEERLRTEFGFVPDPDAAATNEARERQAALATLCHIVAELAPSMTGPAVAQELQRRAVGEQATSGTGVELATLHRAKGLEWDAVVIPGLEEGHLPVSQATNRPELVDEERRLLYVGITRARSRLALSWSATRPGSGKQPSKRRPSRFLRDIEPAARSTAAGSRRRAPGTASTNGGGRAAGAGDDPLYERLKDWRLARSKSDDVPAYVVFSNSTLALISRERPVSITALAGISGVGPAKLERYGSDILRIVGDEPGPG
jgi:DNA helicase II / ATP-dependent DNA helicase PcrA